MARSIPCAKKFLPTFPFPYLDPVIYSLSWSVGEGNVGEEDLFESGGPSSSSSDRKRRKEEGGKEKVISLPIRSLPFLPFLFSWEKQEMKMADSPGIEIPHMDFGKKRFLRIF